jgi:hypothetical protein
MEDIILVLPDVEEGLYRFEEDEKWEYTFAEESEEDWGYTFDIGAEKESEDEGYGFAEEEAREGVAVHILGRNHSSVASGILKSEILDEDNSSIQSFNKLLKFISLEILKDPLLLLGLFLMVLAGFPAFLVPMEASLILFWILDNSPRNYVDAEQGIVWILIFILILGVMYGECELITRIPIFMLVFLNFSCRIVSTSATMWCNATIDQNKAKVDSF